MTVAELRAQLAGLPDELPVYVNWEGELHAAKVAEQLTAHRFMGGVWSVDYCAELDLEEDYERQQVCFVGTSSHKS